MMLSTVQILRGFVEEFFDLYTNAQLKVDRLSNNEQAIVYIIKDFLKKLLIATKVYESSKSTLDLVLLSIDYILGEFKKAKQWYKDNPIFTLMFNLGQAKIAKYYGKIDKTPVVTVKIGNHFVGAIDQFILDRNQTNLQRT